MEKRYDFFISHASADNGPAQELYSLLKSINPAWEIFLDCSDEVPLDKKKEWRQAMLNAVDHSRYLIFITSSPAYLKEGYGWVYEEVSQFHNRKANRKRENRAEFNKGLIGIFLCDIRFEQDLYNDAERGSEYRRIYDCPQHLKLSPAEPLSGALARITDKVYELIEGPSYEGAADLLDRSGMFSAVKAKTDPMFSAEAISDSLIPRLKGADGILGLEELFQLLTTSHLAILGNEGGSGKTSLLTKLFYRHLLEADPRSNAPGNMVPLYVDAKTLQGENHLILRYLARYLYNEATAMTVTSQETGEIIGQLHAEFSRQTEHPQYLLLIDGYNEIPQRSLKKFNEEFKQFFPGTEDGYTNVRVVVTGRYFGQLLSGEGFTQLQLDLLESTAVSSYLKQNNLWRGKLNPSLFKILSVPMYLKMYVDTAADERIQTKGELLAQFVAWQTEKDFAAAGEYQEKARFRLLLNHLLPLLAHWLMMSGKTASTYIYTEDELLDALDSALQQLTDRDYRRYYQKSYRDDLEESGIAGCDDLGLLDYANHYFVEVSKLWRCNENGEYEFIHQIYRDFFCARYVSEQIRRVAETNKACTCLSGSPLEPDVRDFTVDMLGEGRPFVDPETDRWDYRCNNDSNLYALPNLIRANGQQDDALLVANMIELFRCARHGDLSNCDFSQLDLRQSNLRTCKFSRYDADGTYATSFAGAAIDRKNLFSENHFDAILAACINEEWLAATDADGVLKFWLREPVATSPVKEIHGVDVTVQKMLFSPDGTKLYAMTRYEILELPIPAEKISKAAPRVLFKTTKRLQDIFLDPEGQLYFTTVFNSYNPKPITDPDRPDERAFYGLNTAAAVKEDGTQVAFGHLAGYLGLKIYNYNPQTNSWADLKFGFPLLLETYILKLEEALRGFKLYHHFADDDEISGGVAGVRRSFFTHIQHQFSDRTHDHEEMLDKVMERIHKELGNKGVRLYPVQVQKLQAIVEEYQQQILALRKENPLLFKLSGMRVNSLCYKPGTDLLLVAVYNENKGVVSNHVLEVNVATLETRHILSNRRQRPMQAMYCNDSILVISDYMVTVLDAKGAHQMRMVTSSKTIRYFLLPQDQQRFYAVSSHFIYEFDLDARCLHSFDNVFDSNVVLCVDQEDKEYLVMIRDVENIDQIPHTALDLSNGRYVTVCKPMVRNDKKKDLVVVEDRSYKISNHQLVTFRNETKVDQLEICYKLLICGCDFTGITGELAQPDQLKLLYRFGATTDPLPPAQEAPLVELLPWTPSQTPFEEPDPANFPIPPFLTRPGAKLKIGNLYKKAVGGNHLHNTKTWSLINWGTTTQNALEVSDFSILEWVNRLSFATSKMIFELMEAGLVEKPVRYTYSQKNVGKRMANTIHSSFKLLYRYGYTENGVEKNLPVYTTSFAFGAVILREMTDDKIFTLKNYGDFSYVNAQKTLILNQWFTLTMCRYKEQVRCYALDVVFDSEYYLHGRGRVDAYVRLGDQAFFAESLRLMDETVAGKYLPDKMSRLCMLAESYAVLTSEKLPAEQLQKPPVIVLIGEDVEHCRRLNELTAHIAPHIRRLFTYDLLLNSEEAFLGTGNYIEFVNGEPFAVNLTDLI